MAYNERIELKHDELDDIVGKLVVKQSLFTQYIAGVKRETFYAGKTTETQGVPAQVLQENNAERLRAAMLIRDIIYRVLGYLDNAKEQLVEADSMGADTMGNMTRE